MAEYPQRNRSASEYLEMFAELAPYFNDLIAGDVSVGVVRDGKYIAYAPADSMISKQNGEPVKGTVSIRCLESGHHESAIISKEKSAYGLPYASKQYPSKMGNTWSAASL